MTPSELRVRASKYLETAALVLDADPDVAANLTGQAAELALKARYAGRQGWTDFPATKAALKALGHGHVGIHDLDSLLRLSDSLHIPQFNSIDWARVSHWDVAQRYDPVGTVSRAVAGLQHAETGKLLRELERHEVMEQLMKLEVELSEKYGLLSVFSWASLPEVSPIRCIIVSGWGFPIFQGPGGKQAVNEVQARARERVGADLASQIGPVVALDPRSPMGIAYTWPGQGRNSIVRGVSNIVNGVHMVDSFQIANRVLPQPEGWVQPGDENPKPVADAA